MPGLYKKANKILDDHTIPNNADEGTIVFDDKSGISKEDQQDIIQNINKIMQSSKIKAAPELFRIKAKKKGVGFPFLVNLILLSVLAAGVLGRWYFFRNEETNIASGASKIDSSTGKAVIEELKHRRQAELAQKDREILDAQDNLKRVNENLNALREDMDSRVAERENDIREKYARQLQEEREKLETAGTATAEVEKRVRELEAEQRRLLQAEMERIVSEAEKARQEREHALLDQRNQYTVRLDNIQEERKKINEAYQKELVKQEENLAAAERQLRTLSAQKDKFDLINGQIVGYYTVIGNDIKAGKFGEARTQLSNLRDYFNQPGVMAVPEVARRRDVEMFTIDSLEKLVAANQRQATLDAREAEAAASEAKLITEIRKLVLQADEAYRAGNKTRADSLYLQALELIPEINNSHKYFTERIDEIEAYRKSQVEAALSAANANFRARKYGDALASFGKALDYLPTDQNTARLLNQIKASGYEVEKERLTREDTDRAAARLKDGNAKLAAGNYDAAGAVYLEILKTWPKIPPAAEAATQLEKTIKAKDEDFIRRLSGMENSSSSGVAEYRREIEVLKKTVSEREAELAALKNSSSADSQTLAAMKVDLAKKTNEVESLQKEMAGLKTQTAELEKTKKALAQREEELASMKTAVKDTTELDAVRTALAQRTNEVESLKKEVAALKAAAPDAAELERVKKNLAAKEEEVAALKAAVKDTTELDALKKTVAEREQEIAALKGTMKASQDELQKALITEKEKIEALEKKLAANEYMASDYMKLQSEYASYSRSEDTIVRTGKLEELVVSKSYLDSFLSSKTVQSAFPGLLERIKRYDRAFETTGRQSALQETTRIIRAANALKTKEEKITYLRQQLTQVKSTDPTAVLLKSLIDLIS